jgi:hypothetical protein
VLEVEVEVALEAAILNVNDDGMAHGACCVVEEGVVGLHKAIRA